MIYRFGLPVGIGELYNFMGLFTSGDVVPRFEAEFRLKLGAKYSHASYKGRTAIYLILRSLDLKEGDEVLVPSFVCETVIKAILRAGLKPKLLDIDPDTFTIDVNRLKDAVSPKTRALICVHTFGQPCDMDAIMEIARERGFYVIEDCAQALGARYKKQNVGTIGNVSMYSFHVDKLMSTGFGGMILTNDDWIEGRIQDNLKLLAKCTRSDDLRVRKRFLESIRYSMPNAYGLVHKINPGLGDKPYGPTVTDNGEAVLEDYIKQMSPISAGIGLVQLTKLDQMNEKRKLNAELLANGISGLDFLEPPKIIKEVDHAYLNYTVKVKGENAERDRVKIIQSLNKSGIEALNYIWAFVIHQVPYYRKICGITDEKFPGTDEAVKRIINLPTNPLLKKRDMDHMINSLSSIDL